MQFPNVKCCRFFGVSATIQPNPDRNTDAHASCTYTKYLTVFRITNSNLCRHTSPTHLLQSSHEKGAASQHKPVENCPHRHIAFGCHQLQ